MPSLRELLSRPRDRARGGRLRRADGVARRDGRASRRSMSRARASPTRGSAGPTSASSRMTEVADTLALIRDRVATPLIVDADTGYGNALNVQRTVQAVRARRRLARSSSRTRPFPSAAAICATRA